MAVPAYTDVTGVIFAGGASRRFGANKALFQIRGRAMIRHVFDAVSAVTKDVLISVGQGPSTKELCGIDLPASQIVDRTNDAGPLGGLHAGLHAARGPWILAVACDLPSITPAALERLIASRRADDAAVVAQTSDNRIHPLCACYSRLIIPHVERQLRDGSYAMHALLDHLPSYRTVRLDDDVLLNVNRHSDLPLIPIERRWSKV